MISKNLICFQKAAGVCLGHKIGDFPVAEKLAAEILSLPMFPELEAGAIERCAGVIEGIANNRGAR